MDTGIDIDVDIDVDLAGSIHWGALEREEGFPSTKSWG